MNKTVLFINSNQKWGGGEKWHFEMFEALSRNGFHCHIICSPNSDLHKRLLKVKSNSIHLISITKLSIINPFKILKAIKAIKSISPSSVIMNLPQDVKLFAPITKYFSSAKTIYRRGMPHPLKKKILNTFVFSKVDIFIANSEEIAKSIHKNYPLLKQRTSLVLNGVIPLKNITHNQNKIFTIGNMGRLVEQKGQIDLLQLAQKLKEKGISFQVLIAGDGPLKENLSNMIYQYKLENEVQLLGHQSANDFFPKIDLFVFTSRFEGSANALIESLQYEVPAVAYNTSSNPEVIEDNKNGLLVESQNIEQLSNAVIELSQDKLRYQKLKEQTTLTIKNKFNYENKVKQVIKLIQGNLI